MGLTGGPCSPAPSCPFWSAIWSVWGQLVAADVGHGEPSRVCQPSQGLPAKHIRTNDHSQLSTDSDLPWGLERLWSEEAVQPPGRCFEATGPSPSLSKPPEASERESAQGHSWCRSFPGVTDTEGMKFAISFDGSLTVPLLL